MLSPTDVKTRIEEDHTRIHDMVSVILEREFKKIDSLTGSITIYDYWSEKWCEIAADILQKHNWDVKITSTTSLNDTCFRTNGCTVIDYKPIL